MLRWLAALIVLVVVLVAGAFVLSAKDVKRVPVPRPGVFYRVAQPVADGKLGTLIRRERVTGLPPGQKGWRVLYLTHGYDGKPAVVSGLVIVALGASPKRLRPTVVFAHGTIGVAPRCGLSVLGGAAASQIDGLSRFIRAGDAVVIPDYQGLGAAGPHPFLLGQAAARTVIDGVRAANELPGAHAGPTYAVFGESQGGQAAIAVAQLAKHYGHGLDLAGIAAAAPPTKLVKVFLNSQGTTAGNVLAAYTLSSWAQIYGDARLDRVFKSSARTAVREIDGYCLRADATPQTVIPRAVTRQVGYVHPHPTKTKAWSHWLKRNSLKPFRTKTPMLIIQGDRDPIVSPGVTTAYVRSLCDLAADHVSYQVFPGIDHAEIGRVGTETVANWISDRFAGRPAPTSCPR